MIKIKIKADSMEEIESIRKHIEDSLDGDNAVLITPIYRIPPQVEDQKNCGFNPFAVSLSIGQSTDSDLSIHYNTKFGSTIREDEAKLPLITTEEEN